MTNTNTASGAADKALAYLDDLSDDAAAHIFPSDLAKCMTSECVVEVCSVRAGNPNEKTVPLFSREQVVAALASAAAPAEQPSDLNLNCKSVQKRLATQWGFVPAMMYLELTDAMGYDSGEDGVTWSPEEWAAHLYAFYESHRDAPKPDTAYAAQEDAARYRWLREQSFDTWKLIAWNTWNNDPAVWPDRDAAIDAARKQGASHD